MRKQSKLIYTDTGDINIEGWLENLTLDREIVNLHLLREASTLAKVVGEDHLTPNGESCLHQGLAMGEILADLNLDEEAIAAALVYSSVQHAALRLEDVIEHCGDQVAKLINGARQMDAVHTLHGQLTGRTPLASTIDNLRKMLLAMVDDVRVVFIKLAERLCILRNMLTVNDVEKVRIAKESMDIYAPLANRLGIGHLKWQLEDLAFRYLEPSEYLKLSQGIKERRIDREMYVDKICTELKKHLRAAEIHEFDVTGRAKHIYSIYSKMQRKNISLEEIYDAIAFRILVQTLDDCYSTLGIVHSLWEHIPKEFDDYITHPKPNGYRSIHTAVLGPDNKHIEIQIRTFAMHQEAELGVAAHWAYKEAAVASDYDQKIAWLRRVIDWQKEVADREAVSQEFYSQLFEDRLYVFTPNGDVIDLPSGATPLDFAYHIHSELGNRCRGAKVNGSIVPLTYSLRLGEKVEILVAKQGHPSRDWLNPHLGYLKTPRAKTKVLNWFRKQDHERYLIDGHVLLDKELKRLNVREISYDVISAQLNYKTKEDLFVALGRGDLRIHQVIQTAQLLKEKELSDSSRLDIPLELTKSKQDLQPTDITIEGVGNLLTHLAKCCKPVPGDSIVGYITLGRGVSIHRKDCANLLERFLLSSDRKVRVAWGSDILKRYPVDISITAYHQADLIHDVIALLADEHIPIISLNASPSHKNNTTVLFMTIEVGSVNPLSRILTRIKQLQAVIHVNRE